MFRKLMIVIILPFVSGCWEIERGEKVGSFIDINKAGLFFKTWECKLIRGGFEDGSGAMGATVSFTIEDQSLLDKAKKYMREKKFVSIKYHQDLIAPFTSSSLGYFVDDIEEVEKRND